MSTDPFAEFMADYRRFVLAYTAGATGDLVVEARALGVPQWNGKKANHCGFFDLAADAGRNALWHEVRGFLALPAEKQPEAVYLTLNPVLPDLLARAANRLRPPEKRAISCDDGDVVRRRWVFVDCDPVRPAGVSATDAEKEAARELLGLVHADLTAFGFPTPMVIDSGNGWHLWYAVDLPAADGDLVKRFLDSLAARYTTPAAKVDAVNFNPSRIAKLPGSMVRKGDSIPKRPHRPARVVEVPDAVEVAPQDLIARYVAEHPPPEPPKAARRTGGSNGSNGTGEYASRLDVEKWLTARGVEYRVKERENNGRTVYVLAACPFNDGHGDPDSCVMQADDGKLSAQCFHDSCRGKGWQDFKKAIGPPDADHYDPPLAKAGPRMTFAGKPIGTGGATNGKHAGGASPPPPAGDAPHRRPTIQHNDRQYRDVQADALDALLAWNQPPRVFNGNAGLLVELQQRPGDPPLMHLLTKDSLRPVMSHAADWVRATDDGVTADFPPAPLLASVAARPNTPGVPCLDLVVTYPVFGPGWEPVDTQGFHPAARIFCHLGDLEVPPVPERPHPSEVAEAKRWILTELLGDFPFVDDASRANAVAMLLTPVVRPAVEGPTPLGVIDAPVEGSGKSLLAEACLTLSVGEIPEAISPDLGEEEWNKTLLALLLEGQPVVYLDNANRRVASASLASALTATVKRGRILGVSKMGRAKIRVSWYLTGNNVTTTREIARRVYWTRIDQGVESPATSGKVYRHPNLLRFVRQNRGRLLWAVMVLVRNWLAQGSPPGSATLGKFEEWSAAVGGILEAAGIPGFLANGEQFRRQCADQAGEMAEFVKEWWETHQDQPQIASDLFSIAAKHLDTDLDAKDEAGRRRQLGRLLVKNRDRVVGEYVIRDSGTKDHKKRARFHLELAGKGGAKGATRAASQEPEDAEDEEFAESA